MLAAHSGLRKRSGISDFRLRGFVLSVSAKRLHWCVLTSQGEGERGLRDVTLPDEGRRGTVSARYPNFLSLPFAAEALELSGCCH